MIFQLINNGLFPNIYYKIYLLNFNIKKMGKFDFDDTNSTGIWWSTNVAIKDELISLKEDTNCDDAEIIEFLRSIAQNIEDYGL